jgi:beta-lactam-binding protein with PASTA domain
MAPRLVVLLPRLVLVCAVFVLATATLTFAAQKKLTGSPPAQAAPAAQQIVLTVPDVQRQAYVFAKGILEDHGFAWRVEGGVQGFAANSVVSQTPAPGTRVVDNGAPTIVLRLSQNSSYKQSGSPENASPYFGTPIKLPTAASAATPKPAPVATATPAKPKPAAKPATKVPQKRPPAFLVPGAPAEPLDEMPLPDRARELSAFIAANPKPTDRAVQHWLYQHSWIVTGAKFGWWRGAEALELLIAADRQAQQTWEIGARSELAARAALAQVEARSR